MKCVNSHRPAPRIFLGRLDFWVLVLGLGTEARVPGSTLGIILGNT